MQCLFAMIFYISCLFNMWDFLGYGHLFPAFKENNKPW